jgi:tRNA(Arg) A34 adenosine deaminase TadA
MATDDIFDRVDAAWRPAFEMAWESWISGSLGIGCVLVDGDRTVVVSGRNRVLEAVGSGPISGTLLAHAEMDAFAALGLRTARGLTLYTTVEPCLMCAATSIAIQLDRVCFAAADPVFEGLEAVLGAHAYCEGRMPARKRLDEPLLAALGGVLPLANRVWSRPGVAPRAEWLRTHGAIWDAAVELVESRILTELADRRSTVDEVVAEAAPILASHHAI